MLQLLGFSADIIGLLPFLISLFVLRVIFKNYQKGSGQKIKLRETDYFREIEEDINKALD